MRSWILHRAIRSVHGLSRVAITLRHMKRRKGILPSASLAIFSAFLGVLCVVGSTMLLAQVQPPLCGNGLADPDEQCDDGNTANGDGCSVKCIIEEGFGCRGQPSSCIRPICGEGLVHAPIEQCDDANGSNGDGCASFCHTEPGYVCTGEPSSCHRTICGDGITEGSEQCDDGNAAKWDGCTSCTTDDPHCLPLEPTNNPSARSMHIVFVGSGMPSVPYVQLTAEQLTAYLRTFDPFSKLNQKIQFWVSDFLPRTGPATPGCEQMCRPDVSHVCPNIISKRFVFFCHASCRSSAYFGGPIFLSTSEPGHPTGSIFSFFVHEIGHSVGFLRDEYVEPPGYSYAGVNSPGPPNCTSNMTYVADAQPGSPWYHWKSAVGLSNYDGCSYVYGNKRPYPDTIMRTAALGRVFGAVNSSFIGFILGLYGDNPDDPRRVAVPRIMDPGSSQSIADSENALRLTLARQANGEYRVASRELVVVPHGVIPRFERGNTVTVRVGDRTFTQTFASQDTSIVEDFETNGEIHLDSIRNIPRKTVVVDVGLGDAPVSGPSTARALNGIMQPIEVRVESCGGDSDEQDCPLPTFRGQPLSRNMVSVAGMIKAEKGKVVTCIGGRGQRGQGSQGGEGKQCVTMTLAELQNLPGASHTYIHAVTDIPRELCETLCAGET